ncbi:hypothetical protein P7C71_g5539, partial [Lecanoromycetidae sp. Uapishka_2]
MSANEKADFIERLWPSVEEANRHCPAHARVSKSHILFTSPEKPMARAGKGTVQRRFTIDSYAAELQALYKDADALQDREVPVKIDSHDLEGSILQLLVFTTGIKDINKEDDFFARGMDSLQVIQTARYLKAGLRECGIEAEGLAPSIIYTNPTVSKLALAVLALIQDSKTSHESGEKVRAEKIEAILKKYTSWPTTNGINRSTKTVILTGSTGTLGSYLLSSLLENSSIGKIYCFNRPPDPESRQKHISTSHGLSTDFFHSRVEFLTSDLTDSSKFGLTTSKYDELRSTADLVIHNAWQVNFKLALPSYEDHLLSVQNLINFSHQSSHTARLFFISSFGAVANYHSIRNSHSTVPEEIITDPQASAPMGYAESKHIAEHMLASASSTLNIPISVCRVGQIAGPMREGSIGVWNKAEWLPSLVISSVHMGFLPSDLGSLEDVDWLPVDGLADVIVDLAMNAHEGEEDAEVFHTVNPNKTTWETLLPAVRSAIGKDVQLVPLPAWIKKLRASSEGVLSEDALKMNPAVKLLGFYEGMLSRSVKLDTRKTETKSRILAEIGSIKRKWMEKWVRGWLETK